MKPAELDQRSSKRPVLLVSVLTLLFTVGCSSMPPTTPDRAECKPSESKTASLYSAVEASPNEALDRNQIAICESQPTEPQKSSKPRSNREPRLRRM